MSHPIIRKVILAAGLIGMWAFGPGAALSPSNAAHAATFQASPVARPQMALHVGPAQPKYYNLCYHPVDTNFWIETGSNEWTEYNGLGEEYNGGWVLCGNDVKIGTRYGPFNPGSWNAYNTITTVSKLFAVACKGCFVTADPVLNTISVKQVTMKTQTILESLATCNGCTPVSVAADIQGDIYASMQGSVSQGAAVYIYARGSSTPTTILQSPQIGLTAGGVAVDAKRDVYWAANPLSGSYTGEVWKFAYNAKKGYGAPAPVLYATGGGGLGGVLVTPQTLVATLPGAGVIGVETLATGNVTTISTGGTPESIGLDEEQDTLYVTDPVNATISTYSFPQGVRTYSADFTLHNGTQVMPLAATPYSPPKG
jgi:hypothetical protein